MNETTAGIKIGEQTINSLRYADDITLMAKEAEDVRWLLTKVKQDSAVRGLKAKMKMTFIVTNGPIQASYVDNE